MKSYYALTFLLLVGFMAYGQQQLLHEKKVFISPEGRLFFNKALPLYLRLATSPDDNAKSYLLKSEQSFRYSNPLYLDAEGYNTIRTPSAVDTVTRQLVYPIQDIIFEVYADSRSPQTSISYGTAKPFRRQDKLFVSGSAEVTLSAADELSGIENIYYSIDGAPYSIYSGALKLDNEKEYTIKYYAVDNVGNVENVHTIQLVIDATGPKSSLEIKSDRHENVLSARSSIAILSDDGQGSGVATIFFKLNENPFRRYSTPILMANIPQGDHKLAFYAMDNAGNIEKEQTLDFYVDKTPPVLVQEIIGKSFFAGGKEYSSGRSQLKFTAFDNKAGVKEIFYAINNASFEKYERPVLLSNVTGNLAIKAYALDNVNNRTESAETGDRTSIPYVDLTGPTVNYGFNGPFFVLQDWTHISPKTTIILRATDAESGVDRIEYAINGEGYQIFSNPFSLEKPGQHTIKVTGYDNVENTTNIEVNLLVDDTGPEIFSRFSTPTVGKREVDGKMLDEYPPHTVLFLSCTDEVTGFDKLFYTLNNTPERPYTNFIGGLGKKGAYIVKARALDKLGNETQRVIEFAIGD